jgi:Zn-dependent peptidase ImmA (M78 family)
MRQTYDEKYYTLDLIPKYRQDYINLRLNWFIDLLGLKESDWPIDCMKILKELKTTQLINLRYDFIELSDECDAAIRYFPEHDFYSITINDNKVNYPYECSNHRRLNFTLAHELGHIALRHHLIEDHLKTPEQKALENLEADEFAGRFLLPESLIFTINYYSLASAAEYFMVSKTALWKRLNNMKRLDVLNSRTIRTCESCGNTKFSIFSEYCGICGKPIRGGLKGIRKVYYPSDIKIDRYKRVIECPVCKFKHFNGDKCARCGTYIYNYCSEYLISGDKDCDYANNSNHRFCEMCGRPTYFYNRGLLIPWESALDEL